MRSKLKHCEYFINTQFAELAKAFEERTCSNVILDGNVLWFHVPNITEKLEAQTEHTADRNCLQNTIKSVFIEPLGDSSRYGCDDEASRYTKFMSNLNHDADPF